MPIGEFNTCSHCMSLLARSVVGSIDAAGAATAVRCGRFRLRRSCIGMHAGQARACTTLAMPK